MTEKMSLEDRFKYSRINNLSLSCGAIKDSVGHGLGLGGYQTGSLAYKEQITQLPEELLVLTDLETLKIESCTKLDLSYAFVLLSLLPRLRKLHFNNCEIKEIPVDIKEMKDLYLLDLGNHYSYIASFPNSSANELTSLPSEIGALIRLQTLNLNSVRDFKTFPPEVTKLVRLESLALRGIKTLPENTHLFPNLKYLDLVDSDVKPEELIPLVSKPNGLKSITLKYAYTPFAILKEYNPDFTICAQSTSHGTGEY